MPVIKDRGTARLVGRFLLAVGGLWTFVNAIAALRLGTPVQVTCVAGPVLAGVGAAAFWIDGRARRSAARRRLDAWEALGWLGCLAAGIAGGVALDAWLRPR